MNYPPLYFACSEILGALPHAKPGSRPSYLERFANDADLAKTARQLGDVLTIYRGRIPREVYEKFRLIQSQM